MSEQLDVNPFAQPVTRQRGPSASNIPLAEIKAARFTLLTLRNAEPGQPPGKRTLPELAGSVGFIFDSKMEMMSHKIIAGMQSMLGFRKEEAVLMHAFVVLRRMTDSEGSPTNQLLVAEAIEEGVVLNILDMDQVRGGDGMTLFRPTDSALAGRIKVLAETQAAPMTPEIKKALDEEKKVSAYAFFDLARTPFGFDHQEAENKERLSYALADAILNQQIMTKEGDEPLPMICSSFAATTYQIASCLEIISPKHVSAIHDELDAAGVSPADRREYFARYFHSQLTQDTELRDLYDRDPLMSVSGRFVMPAHLGRLLHQMNPQGSTAKVNSCAQEVLGELQPPAGGLTA